MPDRRRSGAPSSRSSRAVRVAPGTLDSAGDRADSWRLLAQRRFRAYFIGSVISNLGTWLQSTAQTLLAYQLTHSAYGVGLITAGQFSGFLILGPWAGSLADRMGRKRVLIATQLASAVIAGIVAALQINGQLTERELFFGALGTGVAFTFALPIQNAMVASLVAQPDTKSAMAMNSVSYNAGRTLSPVLYLVVLASFGAGWAFALNACSFLIFAATIAVVYPRHTLRQVRPAPNWSGMRMAAHRPKIMILLAMVAAVTIADDPVQVLGPSLARHSLGVSATWPAYFLSALGLGTVLGTLVLPRSTEARHAAIPLGVLALSIVLFAAGLNPWVSLAAVVVAGVAGLLTGASTQALLLETAGPMSTTQVMALWAVAWAGTKPIASLADGWLASNYGILSAAVILTTPAVIVAVLEFFMRSKQRNRMKNFLRKYNETRSSTRPLSSYEFQNDSRRSRSPMSRSPMPRSPAHVHPLQAPKLPGPDPAPFRRRSS
jgi:MFS family permease